MPHTKRLTAMDKREQPHLYAAATQATNLFHGAWTEMVGSKYYDKDAWKKALCILVDSGQILG